MELHTLEVNLSSVHGAANHAWKEIRNSMCLCRKFPKNWINLYIAEHADKEGYVTVYKMVKVKGDGYWGPIFHCRYEEGETTALKKRPC